VLYRAESIQEVVDVICGSFEQASDAYVEQLRARATAVAR
jgi:hypothetical protein